MSMRGELEQKIQELQATVIKLKDQLMELGGIIDHHLDLPESQAEAAHKVATGQPLKFNPLDPNNYPSKSLAQ